MAYRSAGNVKAADATGDDTTKSFPAMALLKAGKYYTVCTTVFAANALGAACDATYGTTGIMASAGGAIGLRDGAGKLIDSVGYGTATNSFVETVAAPMPVTAPSPGNSIARSPNGADTNNNKTDFKTTTKDTPGAANVIM